MFLEVLPRDTFDEAVEFNVGHEAFCYFAAEPNSVANTVDYIAGIGCRCQSITHLKNRTQGKPNEKRENTTQRK